MDAKFYNKMPFQIPLRKVWEAGAPPVLLNPGESIIGPCEILNQFHFLAQVPFDFSRVETTIQTSNFQYKDQLLDKNSNLKIRSSAPKHTVKQSVIIEQTEIVQNPQTIEEPVDTNTEPVTGLDFDPKEVNWVSVKVDQLERACKFLNIDIQFLNGKKPKDKKWELVKVVKAHFKI